MILSHEKRKLYHLIRLFFFFFFLHCTGFITYVPLATSRFDHLSICLPTTAYYARAMATVENKLSVLTSVDNWQQLPPTPSVPPSLSLSLSLSCLFFKIFFIILKCFTLLSHRWRTVGTTLQLPSLHDDRFDIDHYLDTPSKF